MTLPSIEEQQPFLERARWPTGGVRRLTPKGALKPKPRHYLLIAVLWVLFLLIVCKQPLERAYQRRKCNAVIKEAGIPDWHPPADDWNHSNSVEEWAHVVTPSELMAMSIRGEVIGMKIIHQSWKTRDSLPDNFVNWSQEWRRLHGSDWKYVLWTDEENRRLVENFYPHYLDIYNKLPKEIYRADMVRNMYMHLFGGIYADLDLVPMADISFYIPLLNSTEPAGPYRTAYVGRMSEESFEHSIPNAFMASNRPYHPFWLRPLEFIRDHISDYEYRREPERLTGPVALKACVDAWLASSSDSSLARLNIIEEGRIYPFTWNDSPLASQCICDTRNPTFDAGRCHSLYPEAWTITYWTKSWASQ